MERSDLRLVQIMLSTQDGGAETFFEKMVLAFDEVGIRQLIIIEPNSEREEIFKSCRNAEIKKIRFRGIHEPFGWIRIRIALRKYKPHVMLTWMNRATKRAPRGFCPILARYGGYYKVDRCRDCSRVIANTPDIQRYLIENGLTQTQAIHIPNFAEIIGEEQVNEETRSEIRSELGLREEFLILGVGRLHKAKAHDVSIRALVQTPGAHLAIAGDGPLNEELQSLAKELGVKNRVHFLGWRRDMARLFAACDLVSFPSRFEPYGNVVVEAWARKKPIVAASSTGPQWLIQEDVSGRLVPIDDESALAKAFTELANQPLKRQEYIENGYKNYQSNFTSKVIVEKYRRVFEEVRHEWKTGVEKRS